jgi:hypothetical protein
MCSELSLVELAAGEEESAILRPHNTSCYPRYSIFLIINKASTGVLRTRRSFEKSSCEDQPRRRREGDVAYDGSVQRSASGSSCWETLKPAVIYRARVWLDAKDAGVAGTLVSLSPQCIAQVYFTRQTCSLGTVADLLKWTVLGGRQARYEVGCHY